jgi:hypothetical protein
VTHLAFVFPGGYLAGDGPHTAPLAVVGLADRDYHRPDRHDAVPAETVRSKGADHRLEAPGDVRGALAAWRTTVEALPAFARRDAVRP